MLDRLTDHGGLLYVYSSLMQFRFDSFVVDTGTRQLVSGSQPVDLSPKAFDLLTVLLENRPLALGKQDLHARIWPATFVSDTSLSTLVNEIRAALKDDARRPRFVRTVHGYGYAFCGAAEATTGGRSVAGARSWIRWEGRDVPLAEGVNILGRDLGSAIRIDLPEISRRHASVVVGPGEATIEDLGSRNGTFVGDETVTAPLRLRDGDAIRLGTVELTFHVAVTGATTQAMPARRSQS
jgi:DNA-binding winged helix-turn-helix (wHTH) protein